MAVLATIVPRLALGVPVDTLDPLGTWHLRALVFDGVRQVPVRDLRAVLTTRPRPWFAVWRSWPSFDPLAFATDLDRLAALYRSRGFYHTLVSHDVEVDHDSGLVRATIRIDEGPPVRVVSVDVRIADDGAATLAADVSPAVPSLVPGDIFTEAEYDRARLALVAAYRQAGYARVRVDKHAVVDLASDTVRVTYTVFPGPACVFGEVTIDGVERTAARVVQREIGWTPGAPFDPRRLEETRRRLVALGVFRSVRVEEVRSPAPEVTVRISVVEGPAREIRLGVGYETDDGIRGLAAWRHYDFLGDARQLGFSARVSRSRRTLAADFLQPHWPRPQSRARLLFAQEQHVEDAYTLFLTRLAPRLEWNLTPRLRAFGFYRLELDVLSDVPRAVRRALPDAAPANTLLSGAAIGVDWDATDDPFDPTGGWAGRLAVEPVGGALGGETSFVRLVGDLRAYVPLIARVVGAARLRVGAAVPFGDTATVPLWERFYAGGADSVRGYARRRVGPLIADDPVGGQSLLETSVELRRPLTKRFGGAVFVDGGQVNRRSGSYTFSGMQWGTGGGIRLATPVGPLRLDLGIPLERRGGDAAWQVYLSIGQTF